MSALLAGSELNTKCQILTTSPAIDQWRLPAGWLVNTLTLSGPAPG
jgi:hypothetical protein